MVPLVDGIDVLISRELRSRAILLSDGKPERLLRELLVVFFKEEELAGGSALGSKKVHNSTDSVPSKALDKKIISAIKRKYLYLVLF